MAALSLEASRYLPGCRIPAITSPVVQEGGIRVGKGKGYNGACAILACIV